jgi:hypothetical protein
MLFMESVEGVTLSVEAGSAHLRVLTPLFSNDAAIVVTSVNDAWSELLWGPNLLQDSNQEDWNTYWGQSAGVTIEKTTEAARSGIQSMKFIRGDSTVGNRYAYYYYTGLSTTTRYYFEGWIKGAADGFGVDLAVNNQFNTNSVVTNTTDWQRIRRYFVPTATTGWLYLRQQTGAADDAWYTDDVIMCKVSTSTGFWPKFLSKAAALTYNEVSIPSAALTRTDYRDPLGAATLDQVSMVTGSAALTIRNLNALAASEPLAEMVTVDAELTVTQTDIFEGTLDIDVDASALFMILGFLLGDTEPLDMDLDMEADNFNYTRYGPQITALLYRVDPSDTQGLLESVLGVLASMVIVRAGAKMRKIRAYTLPPAPEPAVGTDPPAAGGTTIRALYGVVVDMDVPTMDGGIPK